MTTATPSRPYDGLTPDAVLDALEAVGLRGDGRILQLNSYENRVWQCFLEDGSAVVAKFYRPGRWSDAQILEEHAFALELQQAEVPVVAPRVLTSPAGTGRGHVELLGSPPTLAHVESAGGLQRIAVTTRCAGREAELEDRQVLVRIGQFLARLHAVGARRPFTHRLTLAPHRLGQRVRDVILNGGHLLPDLQPLWDQASRAALEAVEAAFAAQPRLHAIRLHGDFHPGNLLWRDAGPHVVDLDDACNGPAVQDLWMLLAGDRATAGVQLDALLEGYETFRDFERAELALIEPLRTLRMLHHSAWIAERWTDPAFPASFPWFGTPGYWSQQITQLREQLETMTQPAWTD